MVVVSWLAAILFFGGWNGPVPVFWLLGLVEHPHAVPEPGSLLGVVGNLLGACNFAFKCFLGVTFMMWLRWTLPRLRIDQVLTTCLKYCTPLAAAAFLGATLWTLALPGGLLLRTQPLGAVPEGRPGAVVAAEQGEE